MFGNLEVLPLCEHDEGADCLQGRLGDHTSDFADAVCRATLTMEREGCQSCMEMAGIARVSGGDFEQPVGESPLNAAWSNPRVGSVFLTIFSLTTVNVHLQVYTDTCKSASGGQSVIMRSGVALVGRSERSVVCP
jgi:hypothetical protein